MEDFNSIPITQAYVVYEIQVKDNDTVKYMTVTKLSVANRIKCLIKSRYDVPGSIRIYKRLAFLHAGSLFCTNGRSLPVAAVRWCDQAVEQGVDAVLECIE